MPEPEPSATRLRRSCTVRVFRLDREPADDLSSLTTAEQRLAMVTLLTHRMWELTGRPVPSYQRASMPGRVLRPRVSDDWTDVLSALAESGARFLVVGAHAMAVHGVPRGTQDLDVWIDPAADNAERVWQGLVAFGAPLDDLGVTREDLRWPGTVIQLGLPPNRVALLTTISGIPDFETAWAERVEHAFGGRRVPFIGWGTLVRNKRESGRRKDLADLEALGELPPPP